MSELVLYLKNLKTHEVDYFEKSTILYRTPSGDQFLKQGPKILVQIFARKSHFWPIDMLGPVYPHLVITNTTLMFHLVFHSQAMGQNKMKI